MYKFEEIPKLTPELRSEILSKEFLSIEDMQILCQRSYSVVKKIMDEIIDDPKSMWNGYPSLRVSGMIHVQDYINHFGLDIARYIPTVTAQETAQ